MLACTNALHVHAPCTHALTARRVDCFGLYPFSFETHRHAAVCIRTLALNPQVTNRLVDGARGVLNTLLADVYVFTDATSGAARWVGWESWMRVGMVLLGGGE